jgi:pimeloyl-ACP methyl ester carboxylesterase
VELFVREIRPQLPPSPPLVAIHGGPSWDHSYLLPGLLPVATARYVILVDMRGCGRTSRDLVPDAYQPEFVIDDLARLMEVLGHEQVDLLGFSTGGQVALLFAEAQPDRIRGAQDMVFPVQLAQRLHQAVPNSRLSIIDAAGHMAQFEQPAPWANAVVEFLS